MIEIRIFWRKSTSEKRGHDYMIARYDFGDEKTLAVLEALNAISENPIEPSKVLDRWPLGDQEESE